MFVQVTITRDDGEEFGGAAANVRDVEEGIRHAGRIARFNLARRPGCECDAGAPAEDRCDGQWMRCNGAIAGQRAPGGEP